MFTSFIDRFVWILNTGGRTRHRSHERSLLCFFELCYESPCRSPGASGDCCDASHQHRGRKPAVSGGVYREYTHLHSARCLLPGIIASARHFLDPHRQSALSYRGRLTTVVFNVPLNNALAQVDPVSEAASIFWIRYLAAWSAWNHVRAVASFLAAAALVVGLSRWQQNR